MIVPFAVVFSVVSRDSDTVVVVRVVVVDCFVVVAGGRWSLGIGVLVVGDLRRILGADNRSPGIARRRRRICGICRPNPGVGRPNPGVGRPNPGSGRPGPGFVVVISVTLADGVVGDFGVVVAVEIVVVGGVKVVDVVVVVVGVVVFVGIV